MSAPYANYEERELASCEGCGGHPDDCSCLFADDDLIERGPFVLVHCEHCKQNTWHADYCDAHGANRVLACQTCRYVARVYPGGCDGA